MAFVQATLTDNLKSMAPVGTEAEGISNFATAFDSYFRLSTVKGITCSGSTAACKSALQAALTGISSGGGSAKITAGITAYWTAACAAAVTIWVIVPPIAIMTPPPGLAGLTAAIEAAAQANISGGLSLDDSAASIAAAIHPLMLGALATDMTVPVPVVLPVL